MTNQLILSNYKLTLDNMAQLEYLTEKLHWLKISEDGVPELYLDNHMMQTFRQCPARFHLDFIEGYGSTGHTWFLDFGIAVHSAIEYYYLHRREPDFDVLWWAGTYAKTIWNKMRMDEFYAEGSQWHHKNYEYLGGSAGFSALLLQYAEIYHHENERLRVVGTELYFGKGRECPLTLDDNVVPFRMYLCGKIDLLMDDGFNIGPMDHKTTAQFIGNPLKTYEIHDGMTGYVYATKMLMKNIFENPEHLTRNTNKIWMNFLQVKPLPDKRRDGTIPTVQDRFKRLPLLKTDWQLETYRQRQIATGQSIFNQLINPSMVWYRNTQVCTNYMRHDCTYQEVHRQNSAENELVHLSSNFTKRSIWDPEDRDHEREEGGE